MISEETERAGDDEVVLYDKIRKARERLFCPVFLGWSGVQSRKKSARHPQDQRLPSVQQGFLNEETWSARMKRTWKS